MMNEQFDQILEAISTDDCELVSDLLQQNPWLAKFSATSRKLFQSPFNHWFYVGDTGLHLAAAGQLPKITEILLEHGADPNARLNHRRSSPLHYASDGSVNDPGWDPNHQIKTMCFLVEAGANIHAADKNGATPLRRVSHIYLKPGAIRERGTNQARHLFI